MNKELTQLRTERRKAYAIGNGKVKLVIHAKPIHYLEKGKWKDIDCSLVQEDVQKEYSKQFISRNKVSVGFRADKSKEKFFGIRDSENQFEISIEKLSLSGKEIQSEITEISNKNNIIEHKIQEGVSLWTSINEVSLKNAIKVDKRQNDFEIKFKIDLKGYKVLNKLKGGEYIPEKGEFLFSKGSEADLRIKQPKMWNDDGVVSQDIDHKLVLEGKDLFYIKTPTKKGRSWLEINRAPFYIDAVIYYGTTSDGYINNSETTTWAATRIATDGDGKNDTENFRLFIYHKPGNNVQITRGFLYFDTSDLEGLTVESADLIMYNESGTTKVAVQKGTQADPLTLADFDSFTGDSIGENNALVDSQFNTITISNPDSNIVKDGYTKLCFRDNLYDYPNIEPAYGYSGNLIFRSANYAGIDYDPRLELVLSIGSERGAKVIGTWAPVLTAEQDGNDIKLTWTYGS